MAKPAIQVKGLDELADDFRRMDRELKTGLRRRLRGIAKTVAVEAQETARRQGLVDSGDLVRGIRPSVRGTAAIVRSAAVRKGFPYPAVYEFGKGGARGFLRKAIQSKTTAVLAQVDALLEDVAHAGRFKGGL